MARTITLKNSNVADKAPIVEDLVAGELATNSADGKVYMLKDDGVDPAEVVEVGLGLKSVEGDPNPKLGGDLDLNGHSIEINDVGPMGETTVNIGVVDGWFKIGSTNTRDFGGDTEETKMTVALDQISISRQSPMDEENSGSAELSIRGVRVAGSKFLPPSERTVALLRKDRLSFTVGSEFGPPSLQGVVSGLADPSEDHHAATKGYVDGLISGGSGVVYKGTADASAADPETATGAETFSAGDMYRITTGGSLAFGFACNIGDYVLYNGTTWDHLDTSDPTVTGVANRIAVTGDGQTGYTVNIDPAFGMSGLADVDISSLADGDILAYNATTDKFEPVEEINGGTY